MPTARRRRTAALVLLAALVLTAACSDDDDAADDPTVQDGGETAADGGGDGAEGEDVCALVSPDDLEALFGSPFDEGEPSHLDATSGDQCAWSNTDAPPVKIVTVVVYDDDGLQEAFGQPAEAFFDLNRDTVTVDEELDLGDEAFRTGSTVWVRDGDRLVNVLVTGTSDDALDGLRALAAQLVGG